MDSTPLPALRTLSGTLLPLDVFHHILSILEINGHLQSLANLSQCSEEISHLVVPYLYKLFTLNNKSTDWFLNAISDTTTSSYADPAHKRHTVILQSINKLTVEPINPINQPETAAKLQELFDIFQKDSPTPKILPNLHTISLNGPHLVASTSFYHTLTILGQTCSPSVITFKMTESACGYSAFRDFLNHGMIKKNLERLGIHGTHTSYLPQPSDVQITVSFRDHLCPPEDQYERLKSGKRCSWDCDGKFADVILHYIQGCPDDRHYPPLRVVEGDGCYGEEGGGKAAAYGETESENEDSEDDEAHLTALNASYTYQLSLIALKLNTLISQEANRWKHNPDRDPTARQENIQKWKRRVGFYTGREGLTEIVW